MFRIHCHLRTFKIISAIALCAALASNCIDRAGGEKQSVADDQPVVVQEGYLGRFNLVRYSGKHYAVPQSDGPFSVEKRKSEPCRGCYEGTTLDDVKQAVLAGMTGPNVDDSAPILVQEGYKNLFNTFNIIRYQGKYYALGQEEGSFDIEKINNNGYKRYFVGDSVKEVQQQIPFPADSK